MLRYFLFLILLILPLYSYAINIDETIKSTVNNNSKVKIGLEKLLESKELIQNASGELLPDIKSTITGTYTTLEKETSTETTEDDIFADTYKITITQNLYDAGYNKLEIERSKILFNNEILNFKIIIQDLIIDAITGYLTVLNYEKSLEATNKNFDFVSKALDISKIKYNLGSTTLYDLQYAESTFALAKSNLFVAKQNLLIGEKTFKRIAGMEAINLEDVIQIDTNISFDRIIENLTKHNFTLELLRNDIKNKEILLLKEKKSKKPNLDISGTAEYSDTDRIDTGTESTKGTISLTLTIPIFQQGIDDSNIRKYQSQILQSELNFLDTEEDLKIQISNFYKDFVVNETKMKANLSTIQASETSLISLMNEFEIGTKTISDIINEEEKLLNAKVNYFNSKKDYLIAYFKIKALEGTLLQKFDEYLPEIN